MNPDVSHTPTGATSPDVGKAVSLTQQEPVESAQPEQERLPEAGQGVDDVLDVTKHMIEESRRVLEEMRTARAAALREKQAADDVLRRALKELRNAPTPIRPEGLPRPR